MNFRSKIILSISVIFLFLIISPISICLSYYQGGVTAVKPTCQVDIKTPPTDAFTGIALREENQSWIVDNEDADKTIKVNYQFSNCEGKMLNIGTSAYYGQLSKPAGEACITFDTIETTKFNSATLILNATIYSEGHYLTVAQDQLNFHPAEGQYQMRVVQCPLVWVAPFKAQ